MKYPSQLIETALHEITKLPGIGKKTALRLILHLLKEEEDQTKSLSEALFNLRTKIQYCSICHNLADGPSCLICKNPRRDTSLLCVVAEIKDVMAIEGTAQYTGLYHVLAGVISPIHGIGPSHLHIDSLFTRIDPSVKEVILALPSTMEGDTTTFYIHRKLQPLGIQVTTIARGVPIGGELDYSDEITLGRSIIGRVPLV